MNPLSISSILLVGTENPIALPIIRSVGQAYPDIKIHTLSRYTGSYHRPNYSKFVASNHTLRSFEGKELLDELLFYIRQFKVSMLWPVDEHYSRQVSVFKDVLRPLVQLPPISSTKVLDSVCNKELLANLLEDHNLKTPATCSLSGDDYDRFVQAYSPCLLKPVNGTCGKGIKKISNLTTLQMLLPSINREAYILQEYIPGKDIDCSFLAKQGEVKAFTIQRGLFKEGYGFSTALWFEHNERILEYVNTLVRLIGYEGIAHLDFRLDDRDGSIHLIDFNARFWFTMEASKAAGVDFAKLYCLETENMDYAPPAFKSCIYLMGKSTFKRFGKSIKNLNKGNLSIYTDLKNRLADPIPEMVLRA